MTYEKRNFAFQLSGNPTPERVAEIQAHADAANAAFNTFQDHLRWLLRNVPPVAAEFISFVDEIFQYARDAQAKEN